MIRMDYETWKEQVDNSEDMARVFRQDPRKAREYLPRYVQEQLNGKIPRSFTLVTNDYLVNFQEDMCGEHFPQITVQSRRFYVLPISYKNKSTKKLAEYTAKVLSRKGISRFLLNTLPDAIAHCSSAIDDFVHDNFSHPLKVWWKKI